MQGRFYGSVVRRELDFVFIAREGSNDWVFAHRRQFFDECWRGIEMGVRISFGIGFTMRGCVAIDVKCDGE